MFKIIQQAKYSLKQIQKKKLHPIYANHIGSHVEQWVQTKLKKMNLCLLECNFLSKFGEIDLIAVENDILVFIEIRYRKNYQYGTAAESVSKAKQIKIIKTAQVYLATKPNLNHFACRFDVITVTGPLEKLKMAWIRAAFEVE